MALYQFDFKSFTVDDIRECLENYGYTTTDAEFEAASEEGLFKYIGFGGGFHRYLVGFEEDSEYRIQKIYLELDHIGKLTADYGVLMKSGTLDEMKEYIDKTFN
ncbi:MAG: hypothetical protein EO766_12245 [Hydrotalea sp. AMD]|uniref:hypothetical protein n=1 Tax=Hydrotalea sp. AMD TaxID=2501297 RepID=UPI0010275F4A|nr:hypothetical protein [Hydrotalea sp. AMD]RWZ87288.1 MAG: hypothetical protein EO766_12245 [Hydrotalea sp. AMD]